MIIHCTSYNRAILMHESRYIHRYYLPRELQAVLQPPDIGALNRQIAVMLSDSNDEEALRNILSSEPVLIHYDTQRLTKEIGLDLLPAVIDACLSYSHDCYDWSVSNEETAILLSLNDRLRQLELEIFEECREINKEMLQRRQNSELFLDDFEVESAITYSLASNDPMCRDDDDNILYEYSRSLTIGQDEDWEHLLNQKRKRIAEDWNDARHSSCNPVFAVSHSWLFHDLIDHSPLPFRHLCRIGTIWVDVMICKQRVVNREAKNLWNNIFN
jgi:hypothetical protein